MSCNPELAAADIPYSDEALEVLSKATIAANGRIVGTAHLASELIAHGRVTEGDPFFDVPETVSARLKRRANRESSNAGSGAGILMTSLAVQLDQRAGELAARRGDKTVTPWHLGYALVTEDAASDLSGLSTLRLAGVDPQGLLNKFNVEPVDRPHRTSIADIPFVAKAS